MFWKLYIHTFLIHKPYKFVTIIIILEMLKLNFKKVSKLSKVTAGKLDNGCSVYISLS